MTDSQSFEVRSLDASAIWGAPRATRGDGYVGALGSLTSSPVWQAVDLLSSDVASLPFTVYERLANGGREPANNNPAFRLLRRSVGERGTSRATDMTSNIWLVRMMVQALLYGNAFSQILYNRQNGWPMALRWLDVHRVQVVIQGGRKYYRVQLDEDLHGNSSMIRVPPDEMIHIIGLTNDDEGGLPLIQYANYAFQRMQGTEQMMSDFNNNANVPSGFMEFPGEMDDKSIAAHQKEYEDTSGPGNRYKIMILQNGLTYKALGVTPKDALAIDSLKWSTADVARYFNVPPHKLGLEATARYSLEDESRSYVMSSLDKWLSRLEFECTEKLMTDKFYAEFNRDAKVRSDLKGRFEAYQVALNNRFMNANEVRQRENLNSYEGGDEFYGAVNVQPVGTEPAPAPEQQPPSEQLLESARDLLVSQMHQCLGVTGSIIRGTKNRGRLLAVLNGFSDQHRHKLEKKLWASVAISFAAHNHKYDEETVTRRTSQMVDALLQQLVDDMVRIAETSQDESLSDCVNASLQQLEDWSQRAATDFIYEELGKWTDATNDLAIST
jgi:HK97 family phage portal protein